MHPSVLSRLPFSGGFFSCVESSLATMADEALTQEQVAEMRKKRTFRKFTFRGVDLDKLLDLSMEVCTDT